MLDERGLAVRAIGTGLELIADILVITHTFPAALPIV